jgi:hypothetical protein
MKKGADKISRATKNSKAPMLAAGAGTLVGLGGGLALGARRAGKRRIPGIGVSIPRGEGSAVKKAAATARQLGVAGQRLGEMATEIQHAGRETEPAPRRSPLEILLEGLTARRVPG